MIRLRRQELLKSNSVPFFSGSEVLNSVNRNLFLVQMWQFDPRIHTPYKENMTICFWILEERIVTSCQRRPLSSLLESMLSVHILNLKKKKSVHDNRFSGNYKLDFRMTEWHFPSQRRWFVNQRRASKRCEISFSALRWNDSPDNYGTFLLPRRIHVAKLFR